MSMVYDLEKIKRAWRDLQILPEAKKMVEIEYKTLKKLLENYNKNGVGRKT